MKIKKADIVFIVLIVIQTIVTIDFILITEHRALIENIAGKEPFQNLETALLLTFVVCLIGNVLPVPTPYTFVVCYGAAPFMGINIFIPILVALIGSFGCLVGELGGYFVGRGTAEFVDIESKETLTGLRKYLVDHPKVAPFLIFLFGVSPLNDDFLTVPLGLIKYSVKRTIFYCWLGKLGLMFIFAFNLFNICSLLGGESWVISLVSIYVIIIMVYLFVRVDLVKLIRKGESKEK
jgi:membrane protein YqaA with SNARE-associated domain